MAWRAYDTLLLLVPVLHSRKINKFPFVQIEQLNPLSEASKM